MCQKCNLFADDTSLQYASYDTNDIELNLNASMNTATDWCGADDMFVQPDKTQTMLMFKTKMRNDFWR